jgi:catechol 2,3-dioxygenase-like lactoylglutathione lyase family enzyme
MTDPKSRATIRYLFNVCNDVEAVRRFYVDVLGMEQAGFSDTPDFGWLSLRCEGFEAMWTRGDGTLPVRDSWASQPGGGGGGTAGVTSWAVWIPEERFAATFARLVEAKAPLLRPVPDWRQDSYWGLTARDPMGTTVEVYTTLKVKPASTTWPG